jgi:hypothetical protein
MSNAGNAVENAVENTVGKNVAAWADYCSTYSYSVLCAALAFLLAGLAFVIAAAYFEARKAKAEAERVEAEARKAVAEATAAENQSKAEDSGGRKAAPLVVPVNAVTTFIKSFATVLGEAKAWVAMVLVGLLLLWMAGGAPRLCASDIEFADTNEAADTPGNGANSAGENNAGNGAGDGDGNATGNATTTADGNAEGETRPAQ